MARAIEPEDYEEIGRLYVRLDATDNELSKCLLADVRKDVPAPVRTPAAQKERKTDRPSRPRSPGSKTNDPSWAGLEIWDIHFFRRRRLTTMEKKRLARTRAEAKRAHEKLRLASQV
jgi:hypothetical protein